MRLRRLVAIIALVAIATGACTSASAAPQWTFAAPASPAAGQSAAPASPATQPTASAGTGVAAGGTLEFEAFDLGFTPENAMVAAAGEYEVVLNNTGSAVHDITFADGTVIAADPGATASGTVTIPAEGLGFICSIPGHKDAGMAGTVSVEGAASGEEEEEAEGHGGPAPTTDVEADPNAPAYTLFDPVAPAPLEGEVHDIDLVIEEKLMTVAEGFVQAVWTFGGTVPGPVMRVKVGDTVRVHLINPAESQVSHSIDFHSSLVAWNDEMVSIAPGEELVYEFVAEFAGVWMYHCGTAPTLHHIANGMYGMMIVEPREGLDPVEHEYAFVQNEWYLGPQGEVVSLQKANSATPAPDFVTFNGVANQYLDNPIEIPTGERIRAFVLDAGPSIDSSFHIVGTIFDRVVKEGVQLEVGNDGNWGSQAVDLSPAQGAMVEFTMAEDGLYPIVTHAFNFPGRGALGLFQAGDGDPRN